MELLQILLLLLSLIPVLCLFFQRLPPGSKSGEKQRLPPGTRGWPLIGENLDYFFKIRKGAAEKFVTERWNKYSSDIFSTSLIGHPMAVLCTAEGNKFLFSNEQKLVQVWWPSSIDKLLPKSNKKPNHENSRTLRKLFPLIFKSDSLREYFDTMDAVMKQHLQTHWNCKQVKVADVTKKYVFTLACNVFLGIGDPRKIDELQKYMEVMSVGIHSMPLDIPGTALHRAIKASKLLRNDLETLIRQRKNDVLNSTSAKDLMSQMLFAVNDEGHFFNEKDIASYTAGFLLAGFTTLHATITMVMTCLAELPDVHNSVLREQKEVAALKEPKDRLSWEDTRKMKYSWNVACEVLRLFPPGSGNFKEAITDFTYKGYTVPKGWKIHWIVHATHKDPKYFPDPENFDPSRFQGYGPPPYTFIPFGAGSRMCPGYEYARLAILTFIHNVVINFKFEKINPNEKILYSPVPRPAQGLPVRLYPHKP